MNRTLLKFQYDKLINDKQDTQIINGIPPNSNTNLFLYY